MNNTLSKIGTSILEIISSTYKKEIELTSLKPELTIPIEDTINLQSSLIVDKGELNLNNTGINLTKIKNTSLSEFKAQIMRGNISSLINEANSSEIINGSDFIALIFPSDSLNPEEQIKKGISAIDLGNCTNVLKEHYQINKDECLYVLNIESKKNKSKENMDSNSFNLGKNVQIEIYDKSGNNLDLSICKEDIKVMKYIGDEGELNIETAKSLAEQGIDIFNAKDDFFNNLCKDYSDVNKKDIIINDRRNDIYQNATFCQKGCSYSGINYELMTANCICNSSLIKISSNKNDVNNLNNNNEEEDSITFKKFEKIFIANLLDFNLDVIKCYNLVFNLKILKKNIGFYCMGFLFLLQIISLFVFLNKRLMPIKLFMLKFRRPSSKTTKTTKSFPPPKNKNIKQKKQKSLKLDSSSKNILNKMKFESNYKCLKIKNGKNSLIKVNGLDDESNSNNNIMKGKDRKLIFSNNCVPTINIQSPIININNQNKMDIRNVSYNNNNKLYSIKSNKKQHYHNLKNKNKEGNTKSLFNRETQGNKNKNNLKNYLNKDLLKLSRGKDYLQDLNYEQAIIYDKRPFSKMYWSFLVDTQIILDTFCTESYLKLLIIKFSFLVFTFQISFFLNAFFYTDEYISDAYHNNGVLDFFSGLPKSIYSFVATTIITYILNMLSNSKDELATIIRKKRENINYLNIINRKLKKLRIKLVIYFILVFLLSAAFLYYVCAFCSVYYYSQKYWFYGCIESFGMDTSVAFIICIFLASFRYLSIKKHIKCFYILANIISNFL